MTRTTVVFEYLKNFIKLSLFGVILSACSGFAQDTTVVDSLTTELNKCDEDTNKVIVLNDLSYLYIGVSPEKALSYANQALLLSISLDYTKGKANAYYRIGLNYLRQGIYLDALIDLNNAATFFKQTRNDQGLAATYNHIGTVFTEIADYDNALKYQTGALNIQRKIKAEKGAANSLNNIGNIYLQQENYAEAKAYYNSAMSLYQSLSDSVNIAASYNNMGLLFRLTNDYSKALECYKEALKIKEKSGTKQSIAITLCNIGSLYVLTKDYDSAIECFLKSLKLGKESESLDEQKNAYEGLSDSYEKKNLIAEALKYHKLYSAFKDSVFNIEKQKQVLELQNKIETEKRDNLISNQESELEKQEILIEKQQLQLYGLFTGIILLLSISVLVYSGYKRKKNDNIIISKEKKRSDDLLLNILPAEIAMELKHYGKTHSKVYELATVLFADFVNFTLFAEKLRPEEVLDELDYCFREFDGILSKYKIEKIKTIGDSYMCAGGIPVPNKTNPVDVVTCGLEMRDFMENYKKRKIKDNELFLEVRIGINSGPLVAGVVGVKKFAYDIWGDTVNIASRMESAGHVGKVNISGETYKFVKDIFVCEHRGKIEAKNKGEIDMYFIDRL
jgi:adenylate cyclase